MPRRAYTGSIQRLPLAFLARLYDDVVIMGKRSITFALLATVAATPAVSFGQEVSANFDAQNDFVLHSQWSTLETVPGPAGNAWRSDGFSSHLSSQVTFLQDAPIAVSIAVALESYPSDLEGPIRQAKPSSLVNQWADDEGFDLWIDTYGRWGARVATDRGLLEIRAEERFPLYSWSSVGFVFDPRTGEASLLLNGQRVAAARMQPGTNWRPAVTPLLVARPAETASIINFSVNQLNGAFDDILVTQDAGRWHASLANRGSDFPPVEASLAVPESRFADDHLRPRYHAMPPANWTNEPHGLVLVNGRYHLFYQRTPNGPFKTQMVWGHMSSHDLVNWTYHRDALRPELQLDEFGFDMKGIWSGDVIVAANAGIAFYTSVNHGPSEAYNPGISVAASTDPLLREWQKRGPIIDTRYVEDFRDPYLWEEDGTWHMIIGAAYRGGGGLDYYTCANIADPVNCWEHNRRFSTIPYSQLDVGSIIWEMPVFEPIGEQRLLIVNPIGGDVSKYGDPATRGVYWLGNWHNGQFTPDRAEPQMLDVFPGHLSPTVARLPTGEMVGIGIVDERRTSQSQEDAGWAHTFSLPRTYYLNTAGVLGQRPLQAMETLRQAPIDVTHELDGSRDQIIGDAGHQFEARLQFSHREGNGPYGVTIMGNPDGSERTMLFYDPVTKEMVLDKSSSSRSGEDEGPQVLREIFDVAAFGEPEEWRIFVDGSVVDVFIGDGAAFSFRTYPSQRNSTQIGVVGEAGRVTGNLWTLRPAEFDYDFSESPWVD